MPLQHADMAVMALVFVFGTLVGSFLNVLVLRWGTGMPIATGRSKCFSCGKPLSWYELLPVVSFLIQGGRCSECRARISWQYPAVELLGGGALLLAYLTAFDVPSFALMGALLLLYVAICAYDVRHKMIPDTFSYAAALLALALAAYRAWVVGAVDVWAFVAGPVLFLFYGAFWLISRGRWMGLGDAKLALSVGWALGLSAAIAATLMAFWSGALFAIAAMALQALRGHRGIGMKSEVPFGPFIVLGLALSLAFGIDLPSLLAVLAL